MPLSTNMRMIHLFKQNVTGKNVVFNFAFGFEKKKKQQLSYYQMNYLFFNVESDLTKRAYKQFAYFKNSWLTL